MKQLIQYFRTGELEIIETPMPKRTKKTLVIETLNSLISVGTEKMLLDFGKASLLNKAKQQPDKVKQVLTKIKTEGLLTTFDAVWNKLNEPIPLGYSNVGKIVEVAEMSDEFNIDDRVVSNGPHAEFVKVSQNLTAKIPENISDEHATFTVPGAIAMQGVRLFKPEIGETVVVVGLGLLGQLTLQILRANGCMVIGIDVDQDKVDLAQKMGFMAIKSTNLEENLNFVLQVSNGIGVDGVIITASTSSGDLLSQAAVMSRKRGRIILIGVIPISVPRNLFYEKELSFQVSSSYGPGRYDPLYEEKALDYPLPFVRWTAKRNMESFLQLLANDKIEVDHLITHRFEFENVKDAYKVIESDNPLGIVLHYTNEKKTDKIILSPFGEGTTNIDPSKVRIGFIGVGNFAKMVLLPAISNTKAKIEMIASSDGLSAAIAAKKAGSPTIVSDEMLIYENEMVNTIFIATRHSAHKAQVLQSLEHNKHVFVEKPLAISLEEIKEIYKIHNMNQNIRLMVGFNRRFAPATQKLFNRIKNRKNPLSISVMVNAGPLPPDHWVHDAELNGGRIIGEGCHFVDLVRYLVGAKIESISAMSTKGYVGTDEDKVITTLMFEDGSHAAIHYLANGNKSFPKERVEVFSSEKVYVIDNFRSLKSYGDSIALRGLKQDKGHNQEVKEFLEAIENGKPNPIPIDEIYEVHLATLAIYKSLSEQRIVKMKEMWENLIS